MKLYNKLTIVFHGLYENPSIRMTETRFYEPARQSTPPKPLFWYVRICDSYSVPRYRFLHYKTQYTIRIYISVHYRNHMKYLPLFSLQPLDATTWLRSLLSKVFRSIHSALSNMATLWTGTMSKSESGVRLIENKNQFKFLGNCPPTPPLSKH